ncbi:NlpC/P60 family protein [Chitinimonas arctica]|uniref:NlpC/P60 family protein n=1 Tax=Chitinimonas arctica TaxID=2594795 RepID=A0A516SJ51_9NEIS|nr:C40 family peptidase [Chitinimonas arctica]QDQ28174.1 NlpC/P60 family protein [Chitinimonas arctica]
MNKRYWIGALALLLTACAATPPKGRQAGGTGKPAANRPVAVPARPSLARIEVAVGGREIVMYALGLIDVGYRFGGKNPDAGLDCSGMVSFIYRNALGIELQGSAADIAQRGRVVQRSDLQAGDLVFFNTLNRPLSHVGIYIGDDKFIHAPSSNGRVRIESMKNKYFATRYETARSLLAG